ncbi:MAG TPA: guanylate kinase [Candidatus Dormibacteraeota bacterium]|nr:guanylate kinase [Candidatus Dormibacteraeota bacterium]
MLIVISGPSAVGKDTLTRRLLALDPGLRYSVSATTRLPRPGEADGANYTFVTRDEFKKLVDRGVFLEHAEYAGNLYGTLRDRVEQGRNDGHDVVLKIDVQGAEQVRKVMPDAVFIFLAPPSMQELERRQRVRDSESPQEKAERMAIAEREMAYASHNEHVVVNEDLERAVGEVRQIIDEARRRET